MSFSPKQYQVTKRFTAGVLAGLTVTTVTTVAFEVGREYKACAGGSHYVVTSCTEVLR